MGGRKHRRRRAAVRRAKAAGGFALATAAASALYAFRTGRREDKMIRMTDAATADRPSAPPPAIVPPPTPAPPDGKARRFRLRAGETVSDGIRRAARGQLADSADALAGATGAAELGTAVHETRKSIKRVRAALRLSRDAIGEDVYQRENAHLRETAGRLSGARDAQVLIETLDALEQRFAGDLAPRATETLRLRLEDDHRRAVSGLADDGELALTTRRALAAQDASVAGWSFRADDFTAVKPGLKRAYGRGRKRMRLARKESTAEHLHDARKRVKDLWHAAELLRAAHPKRMERLAGDAHELAGLLGDHHDLSVLRAYVQDGPQLFSDMESRDALLSAIDRRSDVLERRALKRGKRLYKRPAKRFVKDIARGWDKRVGSSA
jgi:CHAD domain-containing protein